jgi:integration host factor subunit beta
MKTMAKTITKKDLVDRIADKTGNKRVIVKKIVQNFLDEIVQELGDGNRLEFRDFGVFEIRSRAARVAQNPKTMEKVYVPSKRTVKFKVGRLMKQKLAGPVPEEQETQNPSTSAQPPEERAETNPPVNPPGGGSAEG